MTGISTGVGLMSGIDTASLIEQLIAVESRPKYLAMNRLTELQTEQAAFLGLNSLLLGLDSAASAFGLADIFQSTKATSSDENVLTATATTEAQPGSYQFRVNRLVSTHQMISNGFADTDTSAMGMEEISFEHGHGQLESNTPLTELNGGAGVARGKITITDRDGNEAQIDLSTAVTVNDVLDKINSNTEISVEAKVASDGSGLVIEDISTGTGSFTIKSASGYSTAEDLGIAQSVSANTITGTQINLISGSTALRSLNDGNGVLISSGLDVPDFQIRTSDGSVHEIVLGQRTVGEDTEGAVTSLQGVIDRINDITGGKVEASVAADGVSLQLEDTTGGTANDFEVYEGPNGAQAAADLGIHKTADAGSPSLIGGDRVLSGMNSVLINSLNGGNGLSGGTELTITDRSGNSDTFTIDTNASMNDLIEQINASGIISVNAGLNEAGNGLQINDTSGGTGAFIVGGDAAADLGVATDPAGVMESTVRGSNLQMQYVSEATLLSELNYGQGIASGSFRIVDGFGDEAVVEISDSTRTVADLISKIDSRGLSVTARVNDTGDGIIIEATEDNGVQPTQGIKITSESGTTAKDLGIVGEAESTEVGANFINGSYEKTVDLDPTDTLNDVISKINGAEIAVNATLINDGAGASPYRLSLSSRVSGSEGRLSVDTGGIDLGLTTMTEAQDAVVFFGSSDPARGILITSSTNTLDDVIDGVNIDLKSSSNKTVELTITNDTDKMVEKVDEFVAAFNAVIDRINELDSYDAETEEKGILLGDSTINIIRTRLYRTIQDDAKGIDGRYERLSQVGINVGEGGKLELDGDKLRQAITEDRASVEKLFAAKEIEEGDGDLGEGITNPNAESTYSELGVAELMAELTHDLTNSVNGTLTLVNQNYDSKLQLQEERIEDLDARLESKRMMLEMQFAAMESTLASLQSQQSALSSMQVL
ncbi:MAG: flagellar filament capping protein FliD [Planctomycetota bacterium]